MVADKVLIDVRRCGAPGAESTGEMLRKAPRAGGAKAAGSYWSLVWARPARELPEALARGVGRQKKS